MWVGDIIKLATKRRIYVDPSAAVNGIGTYSSPYKNLTAVNALTGDLGGTQILFKRGTAIRGILWIENARNFVIGAYGSGEKPIINGSNDISTAAWVQEGDLWYQAPAGSTNAIIVDGVRLIPVATKAEVTAGYSWWDSVNSRIYVRLAGDADPNAATLVEKTTQYNGVLLKNCTNYVLRDIHVKQTRSEGISIQGATTPPRDSVIENCISELNGCGDTSLGQGGIAFYGASTSLRAINCIVRNNICRYCLNTGIEWGFTNNLLVENNLVHDCGQGLELYTSAINSIVRYNTVHDIKPLGKSQGHACGIWFTDTTVAANCGGHADAQVYSNLIYRTWGNSVSLLAGVGHKFYNNTFIDGAQSNNAYGMIEAAKLGTDNVGMEFKNNLVVSTSLASTVAMIINANLTTAVFDHNGYYGLSGMTYSFRGVDYGSDFAAYQTGSEQDANGFNADPLFVGADDYRIQDNSPAEQTGDATVAPTKDVTKTANSNPPNIGCYTGIAA